MDDSQHHHHHQAAAGAGGASGSGAGGADDVRQHHVFQTYGSYSNAPAPAHHGGGLPGLPMHHDAGAPHHTGAVARRQSRGFGADDPADLFPDLPEGKKRKFILVEDTDRQARLRVRVTLEGVDTREIPDSFRKGSSVYPRSYFAREMQSPPPSATGSRFFADDLDDAEAGVEDDGDVDTEGRGASRGGGRVMVKVPVGDGEETELAIPRMRKATRGKEVRLNDLGYRMAWLQSRVFAGRTVFLQRALDCYRNKTWTAMQDIKMNSPASHYETRVGKRRWNERMRHAEKKDDDA